MILPIVLRDDLLRAVRERINTQPLPAAVVFNSHITGLAVARSGGATCP